MIYREELLFGSIHSSHVGEALEVGARLITGKGVQLLVSLLVVVYAARQADADSVRKVANTLRPDKFVKIGVHAHVLRLHHLLGKLLDLLDGLLRALLELHLALWNKLVTTML